MESGWELQLGHLTTNTGWCGTGQTQQKGEQEEGKAVLLKKGREKTEGKEMGALGGFW